MEQTYNDLIIEINNAFYKLERFMDGKTNQYKYYGFKDKILKVLSEGVQEANTSPDNSKLLMDYWYYMYQIYAEYCTSRIKNETAIQNAEFISDINEIDSLKWKNINKWSPYRNGYIHPINERLTIKKIAKTNLKTEPNITIEFIKLFKNPYNTEKKISELKEILNYHHYIDENYKWVGINGEKYELSVLYHLFDDNKKIIQSGKREPQLKTFYNEFGLKLYNDRETKGYAAIRGVIKHPGSNTETYKNFTKIFRTWIG